MDREIPAAIQLYLLMCVGFVLRNLSLANRDSLIGDHEKWVSLLLVSLLLSSANVGVPFVAPFCWVSLLLPFV